jgi:DNA-binding protein YbaB
MLEDLLVAAVNSAASKVDETLQTKLGGLGGGMGLPGF